MRLNTTTRYAVTAALDIAMQGVGDASETVQLATVAQRQCISLGYLEQILAQLKQRKIVVSQRGRGGGYKLARQPKSITIADIVEAVHGKIDTRKCRGEGNCHGNAKCITHDLWENLNWRINSFLEEVSLQNLMDGLQMDASHQSLHKLQ